MDKTISITVPRKLLRALIVTLLVAAVVAPVAVSAGHQFTDVPDSHLFHDDIGWMSDNAITAGCGTDTYCPEQNVTRGQMAAFMRRLATKGVVDAATAVHATDSDTVEGKSADDLSSSAYSTWNDGPIISSFLDREIIRLDVPAGSYVFVAKAWLDHNSGTTVTAECTLTTDFAFDQARVGLASTASRLDTASVTMTVVHTFTAPGTAILECDELSASANLSVYDAKITAIEVNSLSNTPG